MAKKKAPAVQTVEALDTRTALDMFDLLTLRISDLEAMAAMIAAMASHVEEDADQGSDIVSGVRILAEKAAEELHEVKDALSELYDQVKRERATGGAR